ncbi:MAG: 30S ribosomal protein S4e [Candidatus Thermoplasmatota archaeon]|nr:30S ribosomal protein S4e [Candidatus Thermoplasmatota archaeon]
MSKHLKRLNAPRALRLHRKEKTWTIRALSGPHPKNKSIPIGLVIRDYLGLCDTLREVKRIISLGEVFVDGVVRRDYKYPCGFMDVITIPKIKKYFRVMYDARGKLTLAPIQTKDAEWKLCRIENKTIIKGKRIQLNFHDGRNKIVDKDEFSTGDVLRLSFKDKKILDIYKFSKGTVSLIIGGSHVGETANIEDINVIASSKPNLAKCKGKTEFSTLQKYVFPIGTKNPVITLPEVQI